MAEFTTWRKSTFSDQSDCVEVAFWRKSTFSNQSDCVEVAFWRKSSFSNQADCVEVALHQAGAAVRDSKNTAGPVLTLATPGWRRFLAGLSRTVGGRP
ncbi:DUF397 domain-containing protein [Actinophytocola sp.]|jgi:hypothetical protein|uniref:DUF397 domain-containing protein n=1 Tax=Actinophytocola sp. TaxID=1872138 RepID=UPI002ED94D7B